MTPKSRTRLLDSNTYDLSGEDDPIYGDGPPSGNGNLYLDRSVAKAESRGGTRNKLLGNTYHHFN